MEQGTLDEIRISQEQARTKTLAAELDKACKQVASSIPSQELAAANDVTYAYVRAMLNTNGDQRPWPLSFVPSLAQKNPDLFAETVLNFLCDLCGREHPEKKRTLTPEEELKRLKEDIRLHGLERIFNI